MTQSYTYDLPRPFGPKNADHPSCGKECFACKHPMLEGDYTTLITLGPGDDPEERVKAWLGRPYNARAIEIHWGCATGGTHEEAAALAERQAWRG